MLTSAITIVRTKNTGLHSGLMPSKAELNALQSGSPTNCNPAANLTKHRGLCSWQPSLHCCFRTSVVKMLSDPSFQMLLQGDPTGDWSKMDQICLVRVTLSMDVSSLPDSAAARFLADGDPGGGAGGGPE